MAKGFASAKTKAGFFDRNAVKDLVGKQMTHVLRRWGSDARTRARSRIRRRKRASKPGQSPTDRTGLLKAGIFFYFDSNRLSVVCGPERLPGYPGTIDGKTVPEGLEGGFLTYSHGGLVHVAPRPYMRPAMDYANSRINKYFSERGAQ